MGERPQSPSGIVRENKAGAFKTPDLEWSIAGRSVISWGSNGCMKYKYSFYHSKYTGREKQNNRFVVTYEEEWQKKNTSFFTHCAAIVWTEMIITNTIIERQIWCEEISLRSFSVQSHSRSDYHLMIILASEHVCRSIARFQPRYILYSSPVPGLSNSWTVDSTISIDTDR